VRNGSSIESLVTARFTWDYDNRVPKLAKLYERGKAAQWNAVTDIDWSPDISFGAPLAERGGVGAVPFGLTPECPVAPDRWEALRWEFHAWMTSQFLHGEQGALLATGRLVETVPDLDSKLYAASQVADEARHVEAYSMYLSRLGYSYPISPALRTLLEQVVSESRWDIIYLGMQIIVEGLALAVFQVKQASSFDPVISQITKLVARDEARHVAFGVLSLQEMYRELTSRERAEREEFVKEAALLMSRRFCFEEVWERMEVDASAGVRYALDDPSMVDFRRVMFQKIVSCLRKLGLLSSEVREHLQQLSLMRSTTVRRSR
jgi:hypothetical protein